MKDEELRLKCVEIGGSLEKGKDIYDFVKGDKDNGKKSVNNIRFEKGERVVDNFTGDKGTLVSYAEYNEVTNIIEVKMDKYNDTMCYPENTFIKESEAIR